jgi:DNA polymerase III delta prime subunit
MFSNYSDSDWQNLNLHHAYGIAGDVGIVAADLVEFFPKNLGVATIGNPDFFHETFEMLTIDDARRIQDIHAAKAFSDALPRIFLIELYGITREAQNALLKIIEEPRPGNHFFLVMPSLDLLVPTLRSRLHILRPITAKRGDSADSSDLTNFLKKYPKDKIAFVDDMAAAISDGTTAKHEAIDFLNRLESSIYASGNLAGNVRAFSAIARARSYMNDRAPSVKMLLEYVALAV